MAALRGFFHDPAEQRRYYETLIEASPTAIVTGTPDLIVTSWNPAAERLFGYTSEEAIGHHIDELVARSEEVRDDAAAVNQRVFEGPIELVTRRTRKDGTLVDVAIRGVPIVMDGRLVGVSRCTRTSASWSGSAASSNPSWRPVPPRS